MKFLCPSCKAKYQIADAKVAGRKLKMTCRQCSEEIVIRGDDGVLGAVSHSSGPSLPVPQPGGLSTDVLQQGGPSVVAAPQSSPALTPAVPVASGLAGDFQRRVASASVTPPVSAATEQWHVAINDVPVGPMRREEVAAKIGLGAVGLDSLAWREGLDDWLPVRHIPELSALCTAASTLTPAFSTPPIHTSVLVPAERAPMSPIGARNTAPSTDMFEAVAQPPSGSQSLSYAAPAPAAVSYAAPEPAAVPYAAPEPAAAPVAMGVGTGAYPAPGTQQAAYMQGAAEAQAGRGTPGWAQMFLFVCGGAFILAVGLLLGVRVIAPGQQQQPVAVLVPEPPVAAPAKPTLEIPEPANEGSQPAAQAEVPARATTELPASGPSGPSAPARGGRTRKIKKATANSGQSAKVSKLTAAERDKLARMGGSSNASVSGIKRPKSSARGASGGGGGEGLNAQQLGSVVSKGKRSLQRCYESALRGSGSTDTVRLDVQITVSPSGNVTRVKTTGNSLTGMNTCIGRIVRAWRFPKAAGSTTTKFPILFQPGS